MIARRRLLGGVLGAGASLLLAVRAARAQSVQYTYDALGRLSTVTYPGGVVTTYTYDAADNRTQVTTGTPPPPPPPPPLSASVSPTSWQGGPSGEDSPVDVTPAGGVSPYVYLWERLTGTTSTVALFPTSPAGQWYYTGSPIGPPKFSTWRCKVTDAASTVAYTGSVSVKMNMS